MALLTDPDNLNQGGSTAVTDAVWGTPTAREVEITSAGAELPATSAGDYFEVREHSNTVNNGLYKAKGTPTTSAITADKVSGAAPAAAVSEAVAMLGKTGALKNIFWDTAARKLYLLEKGALGSDGVTGQCLYSKAMIDWKDDAFLVANAPFPITCIDADAGKYVLGQDPTGNYNGWVFEDSVTYSIRTRKLVRSMGWAEYDSSGNLQDVYAGIKTLGGFEDEAADTAYYFFGNDITINNSTDFTFAGPVDEAIICYTRLADDAINGGSGVTISADGRVLTRSDDGYWSNDGFLVGGQIEIRDAEQTVNNSTFLISAVESAQNGDLTLGTAAAATPNGFDFVDGGGSDDTIERNDGGSWLDEGYYVGGVVVVANATVGANDGTFTILSVTDTVIGVATASLTADTDDNTATFGPINPTGSPDTAINAAVDNRNALSLRLRIRDADTYGKSYDQASLSSGGYTELGNRVFTFPLANAADLKITETDVNIDSNAPYTGMTLTMYSSAQSLGGPGADQLVGGPYNFGFKIDCNGGTSKEVHEWVQRQLRKTTDIDAGAGIAIGRMLDGLNRFLGDAFEAGSTNGGLTFPRNPLGGGSGVFLEDLAAASRNSTRMFDNTGVIRQYPVGTVVTLDANATLEGDAASAYTLFYDRTIRNTVSDLVINAGTGPSGTFTSAGANLPASLNRGVGAYVRVSGKTGADAPMNGVYQVTALTSTSSWNVTRFDGTTITTTGSNSCNVDENCIFSPDAIIVKDNTDTDVSGTFGGVDFQFTYDYTGNVQGGKSGNVDAFVQCVAVGQSGAQYTASSVQTIASGVPLTIPLSAAIERNFLNP